MQKIVLMMCLCMVAGSAAASDPVRPAKLPKWIPVDALQAPDLPADLPPTAAGCLVIGHHILPDGTTANARVMQGAFTGGLSEPAKSAFEAQALKAASRWRFRFTGSAGNKPHTDFNYEVVGFIPAEGTGAMNLLVLGIEGQDRRVQPSCRVESLSDWGNRNAIPVAAAAARKDAGMLFRGYDDPVSYWTIIGDRTPTRYPLEAIKAGAEACIIVGYRIGVDGVPSDFRIMSAALNGFNSHELRKQFENASLYAASTWRYAPGPDNLPRLPEFAQVPVTFWGDRATRGGSPCEVVDLKKQGSKETP